MEYLTTKQIAKILKISIVQVLNYCNREDNPMPHIKLSPRIFRFKEDEVEAWMNKFEIGTIRTSLGQIRANDENILNLEKKICGF